MEKREEINGWIIETTKFGVRVIRPQGNILNMRTTRDLDRLAQEHQMPDDVSDAAFEFLLDNY